MSWNLVIQFVFTAIVAYLLRPEQKIQSPDPVKQVTGPVAEEGKEIGILFGTKKVDSYNVVYFGNLKIVPIQKKGGKK